MPKFTIITATDRLEDRGDDPLEFRDAEAAVDDAQIALTEMAREGLPSGKRADFAVRVRDESGDEIYVAALHFTAKTKDDLVREDKEADAAARDVALALDIRPGGRRR
ncbi:MAG: hypothetical protein Q8S38_24770 [Bosea sp. (in: a-proteobacteria)]|nr:hypothetical protein [Bosea sp. (in: a-proteobacteria)]